jgi:hypothetical protein
MAKDKLQSFKIGETQKPGVRTTNKKGESAPPPETQSFGFRRIEGILEKEDPATLSAGLTRIHDLLEALEKAAKSNKDKAAAKKALVAVERTADLLDYLFQTKAALVAQATPSK